MSAILITYPTGTTFTGTLATVGISNGQFEISNSVALALSGTFSINSLNISSFQLQFENATTGVAVSGTISLPATSDGEPTITADGFTGTCQVNWSSTNGPKFSTLLPGNNVTLSDFQN
jgi:hypothetical protein